MRYLGMLNLEETDALYIFNQINSFILSKNLNFNSLIHFGSDGASTMTGTVILFIYLLLVDFIIFVFKIYIDNRTSKWCIYTT